MTPRQIIKWIDSPCEEDIAIFKQIFDSSSPDEKFEIAYVLACLYETTWFILGDIGEWIVYGRKDIRSYINDIRNEIFVHPDEYIHVSELLKTTEI